MQSHITWISQACRGRWMSFPCCNRHPKILSHLGMHWKYWIFGRDISSQMPSPGSLTGHGCAQKAWNAVTLATFSSMIETHIDRKLSFKHSEQRTDQNGALTPKSRKREGLPKPPFATTHQLRIAGAPSRGSVMNHWPAHLHHKTCAFFSRIFRLFPQDME